VREFIHRERYIVAMQQEMFGMTTVEIRKLAFDAAETMKISTS